LHIAKVTQFNPLKSNTTYFLNGNNLFFPTKRTHTHSNQNILIMFFQTKKKLRSHHANEFV